MATADITTTLGLNLKWTLSHAHRAALRKMFSVFGVSPATPLDNMDLFTLSDGANIGVFYVAEEAALSADQMQLGAWIELAVDDEVAVARALAEQSLQPFDHTDKEHSYFCAPGGQVFRLARNG